MRNEPQVDLWSAYLPDPEAVADARRGGTPWVRVNMVASVDGAMSLAGRSGGLSSPADKAVFHTLRALADVVLVGAGTARTEGYGPVRLADDLVERRRAAGRPPLPRLAVVSDSGVIPPDQPFTDPERIGPETSPVIVLTSARGSEVLGSGNEHLEVVVAGDEHVDVVAAVRHLGTLGSVVVSEGGPTLNTAMLQQGLIRELCLTISAVIAGGDAGRIVAPGLGAPVEAELTHLFESDGSLFSRWGLEAR